MQTLDQVSYVLLVCKRCVYINRESGKVVRIYDVRVVDGATSVLLKVRAWSRLSLLCDGMADVGWIWIHTRALVNLLIVSYTCKIYLHICVAVLVVLALYLCRYIFYLSNVCIGNIFTTCSLHALAGTYQRDERSRVETFRARNLKPCVHI